MTKKYLVDDYHALDLAASMVDWTYKPRATLKDELCKQLRWAREFNQAYRDGGFDYLNSWDCGRQDAWGDRVDHEFRKLAILKGAWRLTKGNAKDFMNCVNSGVVVTND